MRWDHDGAPVTLCPSCMTDRFSIDVGSVQPGTSTAGNDSPSTIPSATARPSRSPWGTYSPGSERKPSRTLPWCAATR